MQKIDYNVPFFPNLKDDTHCYQACMKMVLKYFWPEKNFSFKKLDQITAKEPGMWTWEMAGTLWLKQRGFDVKVMQIFDYEEFAQNPKAYLVKIMDQHSANEIDAHTDLEKEKLRALEFPKIIKPIKIIPQIADIKKFLSEGYLIILSLNSAVLNRRGGYAAHDILVKGFDDENLILHNPGGFPGKPNQIVDNDLFEKAWAYPDDKAKNIIAIKK